MYHLNFFPPHSHTVVFVEDGSPVYPLDTPLFKISDDDNIFLLEATLTLINEQPSDVTDQLFANSTDRFEVMGNGTRQLLIRAIGPSRFTTRQSQLIEFLRTVGYTSDDQAPYVSRNLSIVVAEFPVDEAPSAPFYLPITITPVNDRPVYTQSSSAITMVTLDYLPQETNIPGQNASFLISDNEVVDIDRVSPISDDFIGLALTMKMAPAYLGTGQYWIDGEWRTIPSDLTSCNPLLLRPDQRLRFSPAPNVEKRNGEVYIEYRVWDGSSDVVGGVCANNTLQVTGGKSYSDV